MGSVLGVVGSVAGGLISASASKKAASAQSAAADKASQVQQYMYDTMRSDLAPYRATGAAANSKLSALMGLPPDRQTISDQIRSAHPDLYGTAGGAQDFTNANYQSGIMYNPTNNTIYANGGQLKYALQPGEKPPPGFAGAVRNGLGYTRPTGGTSLDSAVDAEIAKEQADPTYGSLSKKFSMADYTADPGYQFRLDEGNKSINAAQAARGGFYSGAALKEADKYNSNMASQEYGNAYSRFNTDQGNLYSRLGGLANAGAGATNTAVAANQNNATALGGIYAAQGQNAANAAINQGNNLSQSLGGILGKSQYGGGDGFTLPDFGASGGFNVGSYLNGNAWSDRALKRDIKLVGRENGFNVYEFRYKGNPSALYRGVMADEVEQIIPEAVTEIGGYKTVNYPMIGVEFMRAA